MLGAPHLGGVLNEIVDAVRDARLVIYNAAFDTAFLPAMVVNAAAEVTCCMEAYAEYHGDYSE